MTTTAAPKRKLPPEVRRSLERVRLRTASETDLQRCVLHLARACGWLRFHQLPATQGSGRFVSAFMGDRGFPDVILLRRGRLVVLELKDEKKGLGPGQDTWLDAFDEIPGPPGQIVARVARPRDWPDIVKLLA